VRWRLCRWSVHRELAGRRAPLVVGPAALDVIRRRVLVDGFVVHLPIREVMILEALMRNAGRMVALSELRNAIGDQQARDDDIARWARCLTRRLTVSPLLAPLIESVGAVGYRYTGTEPS
jgi:DNA-binding response OmpR family regulator